MPYYSFVLLCHNQWSLTKQAILTLNESISHGHKEKGIELIVINNGSEDETKIGLEQIKELISPEIDLVPVHLKKNMGFLIALNIGFSKCKGEIITILNNDLIFPADWFDGIVSTLESDSSIGAAVPFLSYGSGPQNVGVRFDSLEAMRKFSGKYMEENNGRIIYTERVIGACVSIKRDLVSLIGGNDFWFGFGFFDDDDWSLRACIAGYKLAVVGASFVHHLGNVTFHQHSDAVGAAIHANGEKFAKKWNVVGGFDRKKLVENTAYVNADHYFPFNIEDFNKPALNDKNQTSSKKAVILVADWVNDLSQWRNRLLDIKSEIHADGDLYLFLWIPKTYFPGEEIKHEAEKILGGNTACIHYIFEEVPPVNLLKFLNLFNALLSVEDDYVNLYMKYLLENSSMEVI